MSQKTQTLPPQISAPTIIDLEEPCHWGIVCKNAWLREGLPYESRNDVTEKIFDRLAKELRMGFNWYIVVTGTRLRAGKSNTALTISWMFDKEFKLENVFANKIEQLVRLVYERQHDCVLVWDEPQDEANATDWAQIPDEIRTMITSAGKKKICIVMASPNVIRLWYVVRDNYAYLMHIVYRCSQHVHGYVWERTGNPFDPDAVKLLGNFTIPLPTDEYLKSELTRYQETYRAPYSDEAIDNVAQVILKGGNTEKYFAAFSEWLSKRHREKGTRIPRDMVRLGLEQVGYPMLTDEAIGKVWAECTELVQQEREEIAADITRKHEAKKKSTPVDREPKLSRKAKKLLGKLQK